MKCHICVESGQSSTLHPSTFVRTTCMGYAPGHYDQKGKWVDAIDPNFSERDYSCSNGHRFTITTQRGVSWYGHKFTEPRVYVEV